MNKTILKNNTFIYFFIVFNSFIFTFYSGYRGVFPIDSFLVFNSGYNVFNNIHPFKDYWSVTGPLLDYFQSILFHIFNINWFSYILHSALINSLLAVVCFYLFKNIGLNNFFSVSYSLSISVLAYPSAGTPFMDHHAVIFSLISISYLILALLKDKKKFWFLSSLFIVFSFFSKQIPSAYIAFLTTLIILAYLFIIKKKNNNFFYFFGGGLIGIIFFFLLFITNGIPIQNFLTQYIYYPLTIGENRNLNLSFDFKSVFLQFKFIYLSFLPSLLAGFFLLKKKSKGTRNKIDILILIFIISSILIFIYTQLLTKNQVLIFFLIPFCLAISHSYVFKYFNKKLLINFIIIILILTTFKYHLRYNEHRYFMELVDADFKIAVDAKNLDEKLKGLRWISPDYISNPIYELKLLTQVKKEIIEDSSNKIIITDYQILPAITKNTNYAPNKWFDSLSVPSKKNKYFEEYKLFFISKLKEQKIKTIYIVGHGKLDFILLIFKNKNCVAYNNLNEIFLKLDVTKCF